jgi:flagellar protein FlaH
MVAPLQIRQISSGNPGMDEKLGGGIPGASLTLLEGESGTGKSVLAQHFTYGALTAGLSVAYYTTEITIKDLMVQTSSLALDVTDYFLCDRLRVYPLRFASDADSGATFRRLLEHFESLPVEYRLLIVDALSGLLGQSDERPVADFFAAAAQLCQRGRTIVVVVHPDAADAALLERVRSMCETHLTLRIESQNDRPVRVMEVVKRGGLAEPPGNPIGFKIEPGEGIKVLPLAAAR